MDNRLNNLCFLCLIRGDRLKSINSKDNDGILVKKKLDSFLFGQTNFASQIEKFVCFDCLGRGDSVYQFRQQCLKNIRKYKTYLQINKKDIPVYVRPVVTIEHEPMHDDDIKIETHELLDSATFVPITFDLKQDPSVDKSGCSSETVFEEIFVKEEVVSEEETKNSNDGANSADQTLSSQSEAEEATNTGCPTTIPTKSKSKYERTYVVFKEWLQEKNLPLNDEETLLNYFIERSEIMKSAGSLWAVYSMLKTVIRLHDGIDISQFTKLVEFLKKKNKGHHPKKSKTFDREQLNKFLIDAPDEDYLMMKVALIMGVAGSCRRDEMTNMLIDDIEDKGSVVIVSVPNTKTNTRRVFTIIDSFFLEIFRKYVRLRPENAYSRRFFYAMRKGRCVNQVVGINSMGQIPFKIAQYLNLDDPRLYTGHAFRRTSKTLAYKGVDVMGF